RPVARGSYLRADARPGLRWWFKRSRLTAGTYSDSVVVFQRWCRERSLPIHRRGAVIDRTRAPHPHFISAVDRTRAALRHWRCCDVLVYPTHAFLSFLKRHVPARHIFVAKNIQKFSRPFVFTK